MSSPSLCMVGRTLLFLILYTFHYVLADPATLSFTDCYSNPNASQKMSITNVYAQVLPDAQANMYLNLTVIGNTAQQVIPYFLDSPKLATTLFTTTSVLTLNAFSNSSYFCSYLRPQSPLPAVDNTTGTYCPIPSGPFAFAATIPWGNDRSLTTLTTRLRAVDPSSSEIMCLEVETTPLSPASDNPYGNAKIIFWFTVGLTIAYFTIISVARIVSAWNRGIIRSDKRLWAKAQSAGYIIAGAISGERFGSSPALLRFCTPSLRDILFHTQWCTILALVAVQWPAFIYPLMSQTAWASLIYNVTLKDGDSHRWDPLSTQPYNPPQGFADQLADPSSAIYINPDTPNILFTLPTDASPGLSSLASTVGVRPQDLFGICLTLFLGIIAAIIVISCLVWVIDSLACLVTGMIPGAPRGPTSANRIGARSPAFASKDMLDTSGNVPDESKSLQGRETPGTARSPSRFTVPPALAALTGRKAWKLRSDKSSFHGSVLHGNLVRVLVLFHLPVTVFSAYQMTLPRSQASLSSIALAGLSFAIISLIIPALLLLRVRFTSTNKLYDETRTLLSLGPLYNHYRQGSQMFATMYFVMNLAVGLTVGAGQKSGTAQAIVILVIEVVSALATSIWLPWGTGAGMGLISFLFCVARIVVAVLLVILCPAINIDTGAAAWVAYGILIIMALVYLALFLMLVIKLVEALIRIFGGVGFDRSSHVVDTGLLGALGLVGCCGHRGRRQRRKGRKGDNARSHGRYRETSKHDSMSSFSPPTALGTVPGGSRSKGSFHSGPPPSVLKPEHAMRPYREESDDENGYIMGAWQPFSASSPTTPTTYTPVERTPPKQTSGFTRVGGGRAHIDTPYAISSGSTQTFPSMGHQQEMSHSTVASTTVTSSRPRVDSDFGETSPVSLSSNPAVRSQPQQQVSALPAGAMSPYHMRTKSQTAVIENFAPVAGSSTSGAAALSPSGQDGPPSAWQGASGSADDISGRKKKPWYHLRRHRPHSSDGATSSPSPPRDEEEALAASLSNPAPGGGKSFVVIRKPQPSPARSQHPSFGSGSPMATTPTQNSFLKDTPGDSNATT